MAVQIGQRAVRVICAHRELLECRVVGDREIDCLLVLWRDLQPIHHHVVETTIEAGDQCIPIVLYHPRVAAHALRDRVDDLLLEADQLGIVRWIGEGIGGVGFGIRAERQYRRLRRGGQRPQQDKEKQQGAHAGSPQDDSLTPVFIGSAGESSPSVRHAAPLERLQPALPS